MKHLKPMYSTPQCVSKGMRVAPLLEQQTISSAKLHNTCKEH